jgi:hypothetical protein
VPDDLAIDDLRHGIVGITDTQKQRPPTVQKQIVKILVAEAVLLDHVLNHLESRQS